MKTTIEIREEREAVVCDECGREIEYEYEINKYKRLGKDFCSVRCGENYFKEVNKNQNALFSEVNND